MEHIQRTELIQFAIWLVHSRRLNMKYADNINAVDFASNLMSELCHIEPFSFEHKLITEYKKYKESEQAVNNS